MRIGEKLKNKILVEHCLLFTVHIKIKMGCDYYIDTYLRIKTARQDYLISIKQEKGYYGDPYGLDSDEDDYDDQVQEYHEKRMNSHIKPEKIIYENDNYINNRCNTKYDNIIKNYIKNHTGEPLIFSDIITITKGTSVYKRT